MVYDRYRQIAKEMIMAGVRAADPTNAVKNNVSLEGGSLVICGQEFSLDEYDKVLLFGIGKASTPMARAFETICTPDDGLVITKLGAEINLVKLESVPVYQAYHPEPKVENVQYSRMILEKVNSLAEGERALIIFMISGGGSALFSVPPEGVPIDDLFRLNQLLMKCGATIKEINIIRKHVSEVKGGRFGRLCAERGATVVSLILSDVVGDHLGVIASGPTYKDDSTFEDAITLMKQYEIWDETPESIRNYMQQSLEKPELEPPREIPDGVYNFLIGNSMVALQAAKEIAEREGFNTMILTAQNIGEAKEIAKCVMGIAKQIQDSGDPIKPPAAIIVGGEMTVTFDWEDRDGFGPNREFVLSSAIQIADRTNIVVAGADTDGVDGEGKSGAIADCRTIARAKLDPLYYLNKHDAEIFFDSLGDSLEFESSTNVNDIDVILVGKPE